MSGPLLLVCISELVTTSAVPQPGTLALVGVGVFAAVVARRRRVRRLD